MPRKKVVKEPVVTESVSVENQTAEEEVAVAPKPVKKPPVRKKESVPVKKTLRTVPRDTQVAVMSNCANPLIYKSKRQVGYQVEWEEYGVVEYMELSELVAMRSGSSRFFSDNWIVVLDDPEEGGYTAEEVYKTIGVSKYYEHVVTPETISSLLAKEPETIKTIMEKMSRGLKKTVYNYAVQRRDSGQFDSITKFNAIKEASGIIDY